MHCGKISHKQRQGILCQNQKFSLNFVLSESTFVAREPDMDNSFGIYIPFIIIEMRAFSSKPLCGQQNINLDLRISLVFDRCYLRRKYEEHSYGEV